MRFKTIESLGIAVICANTDSQIIPLGEFFAKLGRTVLAVFDKQKPEQKAAIDATIPHAFEAPEYAFEDAVLNGTAESALRRYAVGLVADGGWPRHLSNVPTETMPVEQLRATLREYLMWSKGASGTADLLVACSLEEMPNFIMKIIEGIKAVFEPASKPRAEGIPEKDEGATESLQAATE